MVCWSTLWFQGSKESLEGRAKSPKKRETCTPSFPEQKKRFLEVSRRRLKRVTGGEFIDSLHGIDEPRNRWRCLEVRDTLSLHDVLDCPPSLRFGEVAVLVLDEGDNTPPAGGTPYV